MKLELQFQEFYPHPIEKVWRALTDPRALACWLMPNNFEPQVGKRFTFRTEPQLGWRGLVECEVLELEAPVRMVWAWLSTNLGEPTRVEFKLQTVAGGTRLWLSHTGDADPVMGERLARGWPLRLAQLGTDLTAHSAQSASAVS
jgi:uncharacterized protein YndB with AHSA1/START domain